MKQIEFNNKTISYCCFGTGNKKLIIIPGLSVKKVSPLEELIKKQYSIFLDEYEVYVFDRTDNVNKDTTIELFADDIVQAMKLLNIEKADFFGCSQGGMVVQVIAGKYPKLVNKIVLASTACKANNKLNQNISNWIDIAKSKNGYLLNETIVKNVHTEEIFNKFKGNLLAGGNNISDEEMEQFINVASSIINFDVSDFTKRIKCPSLLIEAKGDKVTTYEAGIEISLILDCKIITYDENYGHAVYDEAADCPNLIYQFLNN